MSGDRHIAFRLDASPTIGAGHLVRSSALSEEMASRGWVTALFTSRESEPFLDLVRGRFEAVHFVDDDANASAQMSDFASTAARRAGVVDGYRIALQLEKRIAAHMPVTVIDDVPIRKHQVSLLVDPTPGRSSQEYSALVPRDCEVLTGAAHALLRCEFRAARQARDRDDARREAFILVMFGGGDQEASCLAALGSLHKALPERRIHVVCGEKTAEKLRGFSPDLSVTSSASAATMAALMDDCAIAVGAPGSASWERCAYALPSVVVPLADNQKDIARALQASGAAIVLERCDLDAQLGPVVADLLASGEAYHRMSVAARALCDGQGAVRVADRIEAIAEAYRSD